MPHGYLCRLEIALYYNFVSSRPKPPLLPGLHGASSPIHVSPTNNKIVPFRLLNQRGILVYQ